MTRAPRTTGPGNSAPRHDLRREVRPVAGLLAWLFPGLGHLHLGHRRQGSLIMFGILFLFLGGLLVGGVDVVDRREDRLWFLAQSLCGPVAFVADGVRARVVAGADPEAQRNRRSLGRVNEMGTLFTALAGLMNLIVILDAAFPVDRAGNKEPGR